MSMLQLGVTKHVTRKLEGADGLIAELVDGPPFHCLRFLRMFSPQFAVSQKRSVRPPPAVMSFIQLRISVVLKMENEKGEKKWRGMFPKRVRTDRWILFPFVYI